MYRTEGVGEKKQMSLCIRRKNAILLFMAAVFDV